ncbi:MAG: LAGLIDADG family homing endonuclease [Candidatus Omnitrophota bacterium]
MGGIVKDYKEFFRALKNRLVIQGQGYYNNHTDFTPFPSSGLFLGSGRAGISQESESYFIAALMRIYKRLSKNGNLAELIGIVLGDGNLYRHPRTENLRIICHSKDIAYIKHIQRLVVRVFNKAASSHKRRHKKAVNINLYQQQISARLGIPVGNKIKNNVGIPEWIFSKRKFMTRCLKGLFETDGCFQEDRSNYAQYIEFKNYCRRLLEDVYRVLLGLGYNPQTGKNYVRLARRKEVDGFIKLIGFRQHLAL